MLQTILASAKVQALAHDLAKLHPSDDFPSLGLIRAARFPMVAGLVHALDRPILYLTAKPSYTNLAYDELEFWLDGFPRMRFPAPDPLFYELGNWDDGTRRDRLSVLTLLSSLSLPKTGEKQPKIPLIIAPIRAVMTRTMEKRQFLKSSRVLRVNQEMSPTQLIRNWVENGYEVVETVLEMGRFSHRGGLLDIWSANEEMPIRIDFFGDEIDSIHRFDPVTQRKIEPISQVMITPAREVIRPAEYVLPEALSAQFQDGLNNEADEFLIPLIHRTPTCLLDYLPENTLILMDDWQLIQASADDLEEQAEKLKRQNVKEGVIPADFPLPYISLSEIKDRLSSFSFVNFSRDEDQNHAEIGNCFLPEERFGGRISSFIDFLLESQIAHQSSFVISRQHQRLQAMIDASNIPHDDKATITIHNGTLSEGFVFQGDPSPVHYFTDSEIFGWERPAPRKSQTVAADVPEKQFAGLKRGDYLVHVDYGIGIYQDLVSRTIDGVTREFICIGYDKGDQLFVPVHQADRLTNYIGPDGRKPELTRLGTQEWLSVKNHVREKVIEVAEDLLDLYAQRQVASGYAFPSDTGWQHDLEGAFPYHETDDQKAAIRAVKEDMERERPMDRLICGDVGFGKTEVALRAAFKAACSGKQVAVLVPTTVLAQQHFETFQRRFAAFPMTVEMLSRFRTPKQQDLIIQRLSKGEVDVIIGTHRLISSDVQFKNLGLVIIDEEQRFGVAQKEFLKKMRTEVDVLTMTATPIPRTLYMALTGVRDISSIMTPPDERVPVVTHVGSYSEKLIRQAILRELERDGQVFFLHNRVQSIYAMEKLLKNLVPEARFGVGHGQLPEKQLSAVMEQFYRHEIDVLLSTSIIESGLDVPNANTLIADRADLLGLAQLYQIRGRIGRSSQRAYAYFFQSKNAKPTEEGLERLEVIAENTHLGAGYSIAMRDLEMRGAGEILGSRQHGAIASVGFHLYTRLLAQAVKLAREEKGIPTEEADIGIAKEMAMIFNPIAVELPLDIGIPETYVNALDMRIKLYRRIASVHESVGLEALQLEFEDRFGPVPESLLNLFYQIQVKILAERIGLVSVSKEIANVVLRFPPLPDGRDARELPPVGAGIRAGKNAYWLTMIDFAQSTWKNAILTAMELIADRLGK